MSFNDFDIEIEDKRGSDPEHFNGSVTTAGSSITITPNSGNTIKHFYVEVPGVRDPDNPNSIDDAIKISLDEGSTYITLMSGESLFLPGNVSNLKIDSNANGTYYRVIVWS